MQCWWWPATTHSNAILEPGSSSGASGGLHGDHTAYLATLSIIDSSSRCWRSGTQQQWRRQGSRRGCVGTTACVGYVGGGLLLICSCRQWQLGKQQSLCRTQRGLQQHHRVVVNTNYKGPAASCSGPSCFAVPCMSVSSIQKQHQQQHLGGLSLLP